jgi:hypothetical protein
MSEEMASLSGFIQELGGLMAASLIELDKKGKS